MQRFKNILLVVPNTSTTDSVLQLALNLAEKNKAKLTVVTVVNNHSFFAGVPFPSDSFPINFDETMIARTKARLEKTLAPAGRGKRIESRVLSGKPFIEIIREVLRNGFDLVIKTIEQPDNYAMLFGSTDMHLLRKCPCPVWLMKPGPAERSQKILAAVDLDYSGTENDGLLNRQIMEMSTSLACSGSSELRFVYAWMVFGEDISAHFPFNDLKDDIEAWKATQKSDLDKRMKLFQDEVYALLKQRCVNSLPLQPHFHFLEGDAQDVIPQIASDRNADLIIMGTVGRSGLPGFFMGNTAESILSRIHCSILAIKPEGFVSPVRLDKE
jgi:nucleotide-binding universal stress UspA family protein